MELVTGGAGFIGSHIVERLLNDGRPVRVLDNFLTSDRSRIERLAPHIELIDGDLRDRAAVARAVRGVETIYHQAAEPSVQRSIADPQTCLDINVSGTLNLLLAARDAGAKRIVFASSCAVYGDDPQMPKRESMALTTTSPYAASKAMGEQLCRVASTVYGVETISLRYFNVFGPGQSPDSAYAAVIPKVLDLIARREQPVIFGDGQQTRDFVFVGNVVDANLAAARADRAAGEVYNIASGTSRSLLDLLTAIGDILGQAPSPRFEPARSGDIVFSEADISAASAELGYSPRVSFEDGLRATIDAIAAGSAIR